MYAVEFTNLVANGHPEHYIACRDYANAWDTLRRETQDMEAYGWTEGEDFTVEVTEVDDDFDFDNQDDWN